MSRNGSRNANGQRTLPLDGNGSNGHREEVTHDRLMPQNVEAEQAVLGAILIDNEAIHDLVQRLRPADFYRPAHAWIYEAMVQLHDHRQPVDYVTTVDQLKKIKAQRTTKRKRNGSAAGEPEWVDIGIEYLAELAERVPTSANAMWYAAQVRTRAILRELISASVEINRDCFDFAGELTDFLDTVERKIFAITQRDVAHHVRTTRDTLEEVFEQLDKYSERQGSLVGLPSGFVELDEMTGGFHDAEMVLVAARPSMGKTVLAASMMRYMAIREQIPVGFFSAEMSRAQIMLNMLCAEAKINSKRLRTGYLDEYEYDRLVTAANVLSDAPILIDDTPGVGLRHLTATARRLVKDRGVRAVFIDYLQLMERPPGLPKNASREQEIATISRGLKALARELEIPVIILAQLNRDVEKRTGSNRPRMSDLRESGSLEQDADMIALLHRDHYYTRNEEDLDKAELILAKQRNGPTGTARLRFRPEFMRFDNPDDAGGDPLPASPAALGHTQEPATLPRFPKADAAPAYNPDQYHESQRDDEESAPFDFDGPPIL